MNPQEAQATKIQESPRRSFGRRLLRWFLVLIVLLVAGVAAGKAWWDATFFRGYDPNLPLNAEVVEKNEVAGHNREKIAFQGVAGEKVPAIFHYPKDASATVPCIVLLYGIGQDMKFLDEVAEPYVKAGFAILCPEQLGRGERKDRVAKSGLKSVLSFKERLSTTVADARRTIDYLLTRPEIDADHIVLYGISLGAIMGSTALAMEPRYSSGILMWGGGDLQYLFSQGRAAREAKPLWRLALRIGNWFLSPAEPMLRIARIAPRPLLFQNALKDEIIPKECTDAYYGMAQDPKEILWYDCGHEKGLTRELIFKIIGDQILWLEKIQGEKAG